MRLQMMVAVQSLTTKSSLSPLKVKASLLLATRLDKHGHKSPLSQATSTTSRLWPSILLANQLIHSHRWSFVVWSMDNPTSLPWSHKPLHLCRLVMKNQWIRENHQYLATRFNGMKDLVTFSRHWQLWVTLTFWHTQRRTIFSTESPMILR